MEENMIQNNISDIVSLYELYGFDASVVTEHMIIFTFSNGYFFNCEIMTDDIKSESAKKKKEEYEELEYSRNKINFIANQIIVWEIMYGVRTNFTDIEPSYT